MPIRRSAVTLLAVGLLATSAMATGPSTLRAQLSDGWDPWVHVEVPITPTPVRADGSYHLVWELHLTNYSAASVRLLAVEGWADFAEAGPIIRFEGSDLRAVIYRPGLSPNVADREVLDPGMRAVVYMWADLEDRPEGAFTLRHRLSLADAPEEDPKEEEENERDEDRESPDEEGAGTGERTLEVEPIRVEAPKPRLIASPLRGEAWKAVNGPSNFSGHRRAIIPIAGRGRISQRFAIDWVQMYDGGNSWRDDQEINANYRCYGAEALAVADGVVVETKDGIPENVPGIDSRAVPITLETVGGNFVILDIGDGAFAFYAHLQPGSLRVQPGDQVREGDVLGLVGNSGNSTEPHLHFHLADRPSPLGAEGIPYVLDSFELIGRGVFWTRERATEPEARTDEIPRVNMVVNLR